MKGLRYILILLTFCMAAISCEREDDLSYPSEGTGRPIVFSAETVWPDITRAVIGSLNDLQDDGFVVWAAWSKDPDDDSHYQDDTAAYIFGTQGSVVYASDDGDGLFQPDNDSDDRWVCEEEREWNRGYYNFAALIPSTSFSGEDPLFSGTLTSSFDKSSSGNSITTSFSSLMTISLGDNGFNLAQKQIDLMYAFHNEDNSDESSSGVNLNFLHAFSLIDIKLSFDRKIPYVNKVTVYGIHSTIYGNLLYRRTQNNTNGNVEVASANNMAELLSTAEASTANVPYATYTYQSSDFTYTTPGVITVVDDLLVFPEVLSANNALCIEIECVVNGSRRTLYTEVSSGIWEPGHTYTYQIDASNI